MSTDRMQPAAGLVMRLPLALHSAHFVLCLEMQAQQARLVPFAGIGFVEPGRVAACGFAVLENPCAEIEAALVSLFSGGGEQTLRRLEALLPKKGTTIEEVWQGLAARLPPRVGLSAGVRQLTGFEGNDEEALRNVVLNALATDLLAAAKDFSREPACVARWNRFEAPLVRDGQRVH